MALTTSKKEGTEGAENAVDVAALTAAHAEELKGLQGQLTAKGEEIATLTQQLADAQAKGESALTEQAETHKGVVLDLNNQISALQTKLDAANTDLEAAKTAAAGKPAKAAKPKIVSVISATDYSYMVDGDVRVTPDKPVRCELREGNLLHAQIEAGLVKLFDADED